MHGSQSIKDDAEDCGVNLSIGAGKHMRFACALIDQRVGSAESVEAASASTLGAASASTLPASNVGGEAPARLASTTLWAFKPHLALPPPPDASNQGAVRKPQPQETRRLWNG